MAIPAKPTLTAPPTAPVRGEDRASFATKANAYVVFIGTNVTDLTAAIDWQNTVFTAVESEAADAAQSAVNAAAEVALAADQVTLAEDQVALAADQVALAADQVALAADEVALADAAAAAAVVTSNASAWVSGVSYSVNANAISGIDFGTYRAILTHTGVATDPSADPTNWVKTSAPAKASQAEAEAGTENTKFLTSLRTAQAIAEIAKSFEIGDTLTSARTLSGPEWLPSDGAVYLQSSYPDLFGLLGIFGAFNPAVKLSDPATLPAGYGYGTAFSTDGTYLSVAHPTSPFVTIYKRSGDTFTKLSDPATLPAGTGLGTAFSTDGTYLSVAHYVSPFVTIYKRSGDTFTKLSDPATLPAGYGYGTAFSTDGTYLSVAHRTSPFVTIYKSVTYDAATQFQLTASPAAETPLITFIKAT